MPRAAVQTRKPTKPFAPRVKVWLEIEGEYAFGLGVCEMLEAIERTGSIKQAATEVGKSYRYVWGRLRRTEGALGRSLVETQVGGQGLKRCRLTPVAKRLIEAYRSMRTRVFKLAAAEFAKLFSSVDD